MISFRNIVLPQGWVNLPLKHVALINPDSLPENTDPTYEIQYVDIGGVTFEHGIQEVQEVRFADAPSRARRCVRHGDTLVSTVRTYLRAIAPVIQPPQNMVVSTGFAVIRSRGTVDARFLSWVLRGSQFVDAVVAESVGVSYPAIAPTVLACMSVPVPPRYLQPAIADFLDRETAKIDGLIAKQTEFLTKLDEHRRALVTEALTQGLDPSVAMRKTDIEGFERVPETWNVVRLKTVLDHIGQGWSPQCENRSAEDDEWGVLKVGCVNGMYFDASENKALPPALDPIPNLEIHSGDVLMSRANTIELVGSISIVEEVRPKLMLCDKLYRLRLKADRADPRFIVYCLISPIGRGPLEAAATGASPSMKNISQDAVKNIWLALPPVAEQKRIADFIDERNALLERTRRTALSMIDRLRERRSALITAAVTGQIDVTDPALTKAAA